MENSTSDSIQNLESKQPVITVTLQINSNGNEVLHFEGASEDLDIDFTNSDQTTLRKLFRWPLDKELKQRTSLVLVKDPLVRNITYQKVAEDYIGDLNKEIDSIFNKETNAIKDLTSAIEMTPKHGI